MSIYSWKKGDKYMIAGAYDENNCLVRCGRDVKIEMIISEIRGNETLLLSEDGDIISKATALKYYYFTPIQFNYPGKFKIEFKPISTRYPDIESACHIVNVIDVDEDINRDREKLNIQRLSTSKKRAEISVPVKDIVFSKRSTLRSNTEGKGKKRATELNNNNMETEPAFNDIQYDGTQRAITESQAVNLGVTVEEVGTENKYGKLHIQSADGLYEVIMKNSLSEKVKENHYMITKQNKFLALPCSPTANEVLVQFKSQLRRDDLAGIEISNNLIASLNILARECLLYNEEQGQYEALSAEMGEYFEASNVYGAEMILRMLIKLPEVLGVPIDPKKSGKITPFNMLFPTKWNKICGQLLEWMEKNIDEIF